MKKTCYQPFQALEVILLRLFFQCCLREVKQVLSELLSVMDKLQGWFLRVDIVEVPRN